jgi:2',3'-cyclic-nucleotide 2'-phosphodiesterase (5'-nucleotidase family)
MRYFFQLSIILLVFYSCTSTRNAAKGDDGKIEINFVQVNDVYEIAPLSGGKEGGVARIATIKKQWLQKNRNTFLVVAGDFLSPSVYNSLQFEGRAIRGRQMVDAFNAAGMDFAIFGNHEFDIKENELQDRINESKFQWISSNAFHHLKTGDVPFAQRNNPFPQYYILQVSDADGTTAKVGIIGLCLPFNKADYVVYQDQLTTARNWYNRIRDSVDAVVAITHQSMEDDEKLAKEIPGLALIIGGHEHDGRFKKEGKVYITKALANARSAYILHLSINKKKHNFKTSTELEMVNETVAPDSSTTEVVNKWTGIAEKNYSSLGFDAHKIIRTTGEPLDGREAAIRSHPTNLTRLIITSLAAAAPKADVILMNAGSIRVDDILPVPITEYDIIRTLPFGGSVRQVDMKGNLLTRILDQGNKNAGIGGYLLHNENLTNEGGNWQLNSQPLDPQKIYRVAVTEFLLTGKEANLDFLNPSNPGIVKVYDLPAGDPLSDVRLPIIRFLEKQ